MTAITHLRASLLLVLLFSSLSSTSRALNPSRSVAQYLHNVWRSDNGFPGGAVYAICQSRDGYLWFGTERGLVRFDGFDFRLIQRPVVGVAPLGAVRGLVADNEGSLWIRVDGPHLLRYRQGVFEDAFARFGLIEMAFTAMSLDSSGELLLSGLHSRTLRFHIGHFERVLPEERLPGVVISAAQTSDGDLWLGTRDAGLQKIAGSSMQTVLTETVVESVNALAAASSSSLWIGTDNGLMLWDGMHPVRPLMPPRMEKLQILALTKDRQGNLWVGTHRGLLRVSPALTLSTELLEPSVAAEVTAVYEDRDGEIWFGGPRGIERLREGMFTQYTSAQGLPRDEGGPIYVDDEGCTWFAPVTGGLYSLKDGRVGRVTTAGLDKDVVYSISGGGGELWLGRQRGGLTQLTKNGKRFVAHTYSQADGLAQNSVFTVHRNRDGTVWAGTVSAGLSVLQQGRFTSYTVANGLESNAIFSIVEGHDGTMWIASPSGVAYFLSGRWTHLNGRDGSSSPNVRSIFEDAQHVLWVATTTGLAYINNGRIQVPPGLPEPLREEVVGMVQDRGGWLWVVTSDHVLQVNTQRFLSGSLRDSDVLSYGASDGLPEVQGVRRDHPVLSDASGHIWLSLAHGLAMADPSAPSYSLSSTVRIDSVLAEGRTVVLDQEPKLPAGTHSLTFRYANTNLSLPERIRFRYRLDGSDHDWSADESLRQVVYTHLGPGSYRFRIVASNGLGAWNGAETVMPFVIEPALWQTWYFSVVCVVLMVLLVALIYRLRLAHITEQLNQRFQVRIAERTRIAQDLHDTLLQGVLSASMQLDLAEEHIPEGSPAKTLLRRVLELMTQVTEEGRRAVRGLRTADLGSVSLESAMSRLPAEFALNATVAYSLVVQGTPRPLRPAVRDEVYLVGREAAFNAFLHAGSSCVVVEVEYAKRFLRLLVSDDGCGIDPHLLQVGREGHWGLAGMRERSERIGGQFKVRSRVGASTDVELVVPGSIAYRRDDTRGWWHRIGGSNDRERKHG